jgi:hypothetical protein
MKLVASIVIATLLVGTHARADGEDDKSKRAASLYDEGKRHFDIGDYTQAITEWKESYLLSGATLLLFNIGQAYRLSGNCAQANRFYLNYKRAESKIANKADLDKGMAKCAGVEPATGDEPKVEQKVEPKPDATQKPVEPKPDEQRPVEHKPDDRKVEPKPDAMKVVPNAPSSQSPGRSLRIAGVIVLGLGVGVEVIALLSALKASDEATAITNSTKGTVWSTQLQERQTTGQNSVIAGRVFGALGVLPVVVGSVMWAVGIHKGNKKHVDVSIAPNGAQVSWSCAF